MNDKIWTIGRILKWTEQYFKDKGIESPRLDAEVLLAHVLEKQRIYLYVHFDEPLQPAELAAYREMIKQRVLRVPVAQILGEKEFMGLTFKVTADTLVPRPDTEILVQAAVERLKAMKGEAKAPEDEALADGEEAFKLLDIEEQVKIICDIVQYTSFQRGVFSLKVLGGPKEVGRIRISGNMTEAKECKLVNYSITGMYKTEMDLLKK